VANAPFGFLRRRWRANKDVAGLVDSMREMGARIGKAELVTRDGERVVVLIGRGERAEELCRAYNVLEVDPIVDVKFDPPVKL